MMSGINNFKIYNDNCLNIIKTLPRNSINCLILDPFFNEWDQYIDKIDFSCLSENAVVIAFSNRPHTGRIQVNLDKKLNFVTEIVWNFADGRWVSNKLPRICHENILIYTNSKKNPLNDMRLLEWIEKPKQVKKGGASIGKWTCETRTYTPQDLSQVESVIYLPRNVGKKMGIVSKPLELTNLLIKMCTKENDFILDPFMGSGTFGVSCLNNNRRFIGIEIDKQNFMIAKDRIENTYKEIEQVAS
ncbi:DNA-methyltransferase [Clostridium perfringens]|uniref:DNA-methyltransferase n=1 Tax=Clostridium perfringens TaxID=1502 RepID=UPI00233F882E|nr:site-specific DNA-methyltransferase [Clostridium perfringens]MDC4245641.1 site-specific DNA-methyltransferase [Clostridium perfringens]